MTPRTASEPALARSSARRGLWIALGLALGMAVVNSYARFAYALVLPAMRADLGWSYTEAGALNTANAVGYLIGAAAAFRSVRRLGATMPFIAGLWVTTVSVALVGAFADFRILSALRLVAGISGAYVFITGSVLAASIFPGQAAASARAIAIYFGGGGFGLLLTAIAIPPLLSLAGDAAWPKAWLVLGGLCAVSSAAATLAARRVVAPPTASAPVPWAKAPLLATFLAYACFAFGYTAYMTFIVAHMRENGAGQVAIAAMWATLGMTTLAGPRIWSGAMAAWPPGFALAGILLTIGMGAALPVLSAASAVMLVSAALFGTFFMTPASVTAIVRGALPPVVWGEAVAAFTLMFAILQCFGPILTGALADLTGNLADGLSVSAAVLVSGAALALLQGLDPRPGKPRSPTP